VLKSFKELNESENVENLKVKGASEWARPKLENKKFTSSTLIRSYMKPQIFPYEELLYDSPSGIVVCCGTMLQAGRSRVRFSIRSFDFSFDLILPAAIWALGSTQPLPEMSLMNLPGSKRRLACKADILTAICEPWRLTTLWASMTCYRDSFTFLYRGDWCNGDRVCAPFE
jgi:hypothetical protein